MAGGIGDLEWAPPRVDALPALEHRERACRNGTDLAPQTLHGVAVKQRRARQEPGRIDEMRRAALVHVDAERWIFTDEHAGRTGVIQMDVRQEQRRHIPDRQAGGGERGAQRGQCARRSWIDDRGAAGSVEERGGNDARARLEL